MGNLNWPPEKTFKYEFNTDLAMEIPAFNGSKRAKKALSKTEINHNDMTNNQR